MTWELFILACLLLSPWRSRSELAPGDNPVTSIWGPVLLGVERGRGKAVPPFLTMWTSAGMPSPPGPVVRICTRA